MAKKKIKHVVNWNRITLILTIAGVVIATIPSWNQIEIDILQARLSDTEKEMEKLEAEVDPEWYKKFNDQREFYSYEIKSRNKIIGDTSVELDSLKKIVAHSSIQDNNKIIFTVEEARKVAIRVLIGKRDSTLIVDYYEPIIELYDSLTNTLKHSNNIKQSIIKNHESIEANQNLIIEYYKNSYGLQKKTPQDIAIILILSLLLILTGYRIIKSMLNNLENR